MFAALAIEREPLRYSDAIPGLSTWLIVAGAVAAIALLLWLAVGWAQWRPQERAAVPRWQVSFVFFCCLLSALAYALFAVTTLIDSIRTKVETASASQSMPWPTRFLIAAGFFAILAVGQAFVLNLFQERIRRILALAKLSFKEAVRSRVLYAFSAILIVFLFASWYIPSKSEDQVRTYVKVFFMAMSFLLLFTAALLSSFSIPTDIKQQTIHTIVTKPVQRFEVVLGRYVGFLALMTLVLLVMTGLSLVFVIRGINPDAAEESLKAREPLYGTDLLYENTGNERQGVNVGREWDYRRYITAPSNRRDPPQTARWDFDRVPAYLGDRREVRCEYGFDVYRTTKGKEGAPVACTFKFYTWRYKPGNEDEFIKKRGAATLDPIRASKLAEDLGYYELNSLPVVDYHTQAFTLPGGLFRNATAADPEREEELKRLNQPKPPALRIRVTCDSATQYVGMAKHDLYIRLDDTNRSDKLLFALNFFKASFGLWLSIALMLGLAVVLSTYLSGVISLLVTLVIFLFGVYKEFVQEVALGRNVGGGPLEALKRLANRDLPSVSARQSGSMGDQLIATSDDAFRVLIRVVDLVIPDVDRFNLTDYVAEGFNISTEQMLMSGGYLFLYLLPWAVLAFFLIKWREVASTN
jgi:hypothetical protein